MTSVRYNLAEASADLREADGDLQDLLRALRLEVDLGAFSPEVNLAQQPAWDALMAAVDLFDAGSRVVYGLLEGRDETVHAVANDAKRACAMLVDPKVRSNLDECWQEGFNEIHSRVNRVCGSLGRLRPLGVLGDGVPETSAPFRRGLPYAIVNVAVRVLPAVRRDRYLEEFQAEMADLGGSWARLHYVVRVGARLLLLRRCLTFSASPLATQTSETDES